jgi:hypothetical protein
LGCRNFVIPQSSKPNHLNPLLMHKFIRANETHRDVPRDLHPARFQNRIRDWLLVTVVQQIDSGINIALTRTRS